jgi:1-acyl-sn-glycerol-3-phosphate acyltransferase
MTVKDFLWIPVNVLQAAWLAVFSLFCFVVVMTVYALTWNPDGALSVARVIYGPVNMTFGFSRMVVEGREHIPADKPYILMMNHQSAADIMVAWMITPTPVRFIAKHVLSYVPVVGWTMWIFGMVSIDRGDAHSSAKALKKAARVLRNGRSLCAFPEGTRTRDGRIGPFKKGVFLLATKAGVPIVPVAAVGLDVFMPAKGWHPRPAAIRVKIGAPIPTEGEGEAAVQRDALIKQVRDAMIDMSLEIGGAGGDKERAIADSKAAVPHAAGAAA